MPSSTTLSSSATAIGTRRNADVLVFSFGHWTISIFGTSRFLIISLNAEDEVDCPRSAGQHSH